MTLSVNDQQICERIIHATVNTDRPDTDPITSGEIQEFSNQTIGSVDAGLLSQALKNDGAIDEKELNSFKKAGMSPRAQEMAQYIGTAPRKLFQAAMVFADVRVYQRCHSGSFGVADKKPKNDCFYTLEGTLDREDKEIEQAVGNLNQHLQAGYDIQPMLSRLFRNKMPTQALYHLERLDFFLMTPRQKNFIISKLKSWISASRNDPEKSNVYDLGPWHFSQALKIFGKCGPEGAKALKAIEPELSRHQNSSQWKLNPRHAENALKTYQELRKNI